MSGPIIIPPTPLVVPPSGLDEIIHTFGRLDDPHFELNNIVKLPFPYPIRYNGQPQVSGRCHRLLVPHFTAVLQEIKDANLTDFANDYGGIFATRPIRGFPSHPSCHSWGIAIDLEPLDNPLGAKLGKMDPRITAIFKKHGWFWGGDFKSRKDWMHYQFAINY